MSCCRKTDDGASLSAIQQIFRTGGETYGSQRVHINLLEKGYGVMEKRVARLTRENGLALCTNQGYRIPNTHAEANNKVVILHLNVKSQP